MSHSRIQLFRIPALGLSLAAAVTLLVWAGAVSAQQSLPVRVRGEVVKTEGNKLFVKTREGGDLIVNVPDNLAVTGIVRIALDEVKPGSYIGISAIPDPDGSQNALHIHIFPEAMRGVAEGHGAWDVRPGATMTNATVDQVTAVGAGRTLTVKYKDGEKKIVVPAGIPIVTYVPGTRDELKPGAKIFIVAAQRQPDGSVNAARVSVGRDGLTPPM